MKIENKIIHPFYFNIAKLFYAIARSDNKIHDTEINKVNKLIKTHWLNIGIAAEETENNAGLQLESIFDWLKNQPQFNATRCFNDFIEYKNAQKHLFTPDIKKRILKTANAIATAFSGVNKSELIMIAKLSLEFKNEL